MPALRGTDRAAALVVMAILASILTAPGARAEGGAGKAIEGVVNLNTAGADRLELLPGIGPAKVRSIVWYRQRHPFRTVDELVRIKGIGRKMVRRLRPHLAVSGPTTAQTIRLARGVEPPPAEARPPPRPLPRPPPPACVPARTTVVRMAAADTRLARSPANHCMRRP